MKITVSCIPNWLDNISKIMTSPWAVRNCNEHYFGQCFVKPINEMEINFYASDSLKTIQERLHSN